MKSLFYTKFILFILFVCFSNSSFCQNNINIAFKDAISAPQNLSICGDATEVTLKISLDENGIDIKDLIANVKLFKGIRLSAFNSDKSSNGVSLSSGLNTGNPVFNLPALSKNGVQEIFVSYSIIADCNYLDTLALNDKLLVKDAWDFTYKNNANQTLVKKDFSTEYRDALKLPLLALDILNKNSKQNVGQPFQRTIQVTNSGLNGYLKNFQYSNTQGAGIWIKSLKVNNQNITFSKTVTFLNDTIITANITGEFFVFNTKGSGGMGNNNNTLDPDELVTIVETGEIVSCIKSKMSTHRAEWGCFNKLCSASQKSDEIQIPQGSIFVEFTKGGINPDVNAGYCKEGKSTIVFKNTGVEVDLGTANMYNVSTGIGLGNSFKIADGGFRILSLKIAGKSIPVNQLSTSIDLNNNPLFATDPDGPGGLADLDGDGFFDDLPRNQSITLEVIYAVDCINTSIIPAKGPCKNDLSTAFIGKLDYSNFCNDRVSFKSDPYFIPINILDSYENCSDPDAFTDGKTFNITHEEIRNVFNFENQCGGAEQLIVSVILPKGITPDLGQTSLKRLSQVFPLLNHTTVNDTLKLFFDASNIVFLNGVYKISLGLKADCQANAGQSVIPIIFDHYCVDCNCKHTFY
jgi:hypothetical protein